jgi:hypothetical protein
MKFKECKICSIKVNDKAHLTRHLSSAHGLKGKPGLEKYYLKYLSNLDEPELYSCCSKPKPFVGFIKGYSNKQCPDCTLKEQKIPCTKCDRKFKTMRHLSNHLNLSHDISSQDQKEYFDKTYGESQCLNCNESAIFQNLSKGYKKLCKVCNEIKGVHNKSSKVHWEILHKMQSNEAEIKAKSFNPYTYEYYERIYGKDLAIEKFNESVNNNSDIFWESRGHDKEQIKDLKINKSHKQYWLNRGYSEKDASFEVRKNNVWCEEYWTERGFDKSTAMQLKKKSNILCEEYWINLGHTQEEAQDLVHLSSPFSIKFWEAKGFTKKESENILKRQCPTYEEYWEGKPKDKRDITMFYLKPEYWIAKGFTKNEAVQIAANKNPYSNRSWSKISQELFWEITNELFKEDLTFVFASNDGTNQKPKEYNLQQNYEEVIDTIDKKYPHSFLRIDFFIPELKLAIEFDGSYWHNRDDEQNKKDEMRNQIYQNLDIKYLNVCEIEFNKNRNVVINNCIEFIKQHKEPNNE